MAQTIDPPTTGRRLVLGSAYWRIWWANTVSSVGDGAFVSALPLLAVTVTRDPRLIAVVSASFYLPWLLLSLPIGALVDRYDRVRIMWRSQAVQGLRVTPAHHRKSSWPAGGLPACAPARS